MTLETILFIIVMLHLAVGFGYVVYKLEFQGKNKEKKTIEDEKKDSDIS